MFGCFAMTVCLATKPMTMRAQVSGAELKASAVDIEIAVRVSIAEKTRSERNLNIFSKF